MELLQLIFIVSINGFKITMVTYIEVYLLMSFQKGLTKESETILNMNSTTIPRAGVRNLLKRRKQTEY